jgi:hypothetical protein
METRASQAQGHRRCTSVSETQCLGFASLCLAHFLLARAGCHSLILFTH